MKRLLALLLLVFASSAYAQPTTTGGGTIKSLSQIQIDSCSDGQVIAYADSTSEWVCSAGGGAGSSIILDLADDGSNESTATAEIATTGDTNSIFTEPSNNKLLIDVTKNWPVADTATSAGTATSATTAATASALAANGANCSAGQIPLGVDASGAVEGCYAAGPIFDIGDDGGNDSTRVTEIATTGDTNAIFTEPSADKILIDLTKKWPLAGAADTATTATSATSATTATTATSAGTATALAANGANCSAGQVPLGVDASGAVEGCYAAGSGTASVFTLADTTPSVTMATRYYECDDTTTITDFVDADGDYSDFSADFHIHITAKDTCVLDFSAGNIIGNQGSAWTAAVGDTANCYFSVALDGWNCFVSDPDGVSGAFTQESSTIVAPATGTTEWTRVCGDAGCVAVGSTNGGTAMEFDLDNDQAADCTLSKTAGVSTFDCNNTNFTASPGQSGGNIVLNDFGGTACLTIDPDNGNVTQGTNCDLLNFDKWIGSMVNHASITAATLVLSGADCKGGYIKNGDADALDITLCDGVSGGGQLVCVEDRAGGVITVDVNDAGETITLADGTALTAGNAIDLASGIGNGFCIMSDSATAWHILPGAVGTIADGGAD